MTITTRFARGSASVLLLLLCACNGSRKGSTADAAMDGPMVEAANDRATPSDTGETAAETAGETAGDGGGVRSVTMFLPNSLNGIAYRYAISADADPVLNGMENVTRAAGGAMRADGTLFIGAYEANARLFPFTTPLTAFTAGPEIKDLGLNFPQEMSFVDNELWIVNSAEHACTTEPQSIVRVAFDAQGAASNAGTVTNALIGANRGMLWVPATRDLYVTQCAPINVIQHLRVAADHSVTAMPAITGSGINNPHGMVMTSWGELLVANFNAQNVLRLTVDAQGAATVNGTITGNGLSSPVGMTFTPWGELYVINQGDASISRFGFAADHSAVDRGNFKANVPSVAGQYGIGWAVIVP